jgi:arylsulfatase
MDDMARSPMGVSWPSRIKDKGGIGKEFTHSIDIVPAIREATGSPVPKAVDGVQQKPMDEVAFLSTFGNVKAKPFARGNILKSSVSNRSLSRAGWKKCISILNLQVVKKSRLRAALVTRKT